jgi:Cu(I)/Ag(I) efflux system membrane fusion protein
MDMQLVPRYADEDAASGSVRIDPAVAQNLGVRVATVARMSASPQVTATGTVTYNDRDVSVVQARSGGFVERVNPLAPGDVIPAGAVLVEMYVPEWSAAQQEYLALRGIGQGELLQAARERMRLAGMPDAMIRDVEASGAPRPTGVVVAPRAGVIQELGVRAGMTLMPGQTIARINGIGTVWLDVAVPESQAGDVKIGQSAQARLPALPGETLQGRVTALLPALNEMSRTLRVRVELPNKGGRLRPGLSGQVTLTGGAAEVSLAVPTEAVIRTGQRALVILAEDAGRFRPVEVVLGGESGGQTRILAGLAEGQKVVSSGQFLIDSEASLRGLVAQATGSAAAPAAAAAALHEADGTVDEISPTEATISHGPFKSLNMPGMTMPFALARPELAKGIRAGDKVRFGVRQTDSGLVVERIEKTGGTR